jgi:hypothetical protein
MENCSEDIFLYYTHDLSFLKLAYGKRANLLNKLFVIISVFVLLFYFINFKPYKIFIALGYSICTGVIFEFIRRKIITKNSNIAGKYDFAQAKVQSSRIKAFFLMDYVYNKGLLNKDGLEYLINIYSKKSEKNRFQGIAIGIILVSAVTQTAVDFLITSEHKDWERLKLYIEFFRANSTFYITIVVAIIILFLMMRFSYYETIALFINRKSNSYQQLSSYLEERILPKILKYSDLEIKDEQYKSILGSIKVGSLPYNEPISKSQASKSKNTKKNNGKRTKRSN